MIAQVQKAKSRAARIARWLLGGLAALMLLAFVVDRISPWPVALITRTAFTRGARSAYHGLERHLPATVVYMQRNQHYDASDPDGYLDVYSSKPFNGTAQPDATVIWLHGGAWLSGNKNDVANYARILAARGPTVVAVDYSLAPASLYPTPVLQLNAALGYLINNAERLHIDPDRLFLAGDSAGAQLAAQMANIVASPAYARTMAVHPSIQRSQLKGVVLFCGVYDLNTVDLSGVGGFFMRNALRSYMGHRDFGSTERFAEASVAHYVTPEFPPAFLSVGNADPFAGQTEQMIQALKRNGVLTDTLLYRDSYTPALPHEYQFDLDLEAGREALSRVLRFVENH